AWAAEVRREYTGLPLEAEDRAVDVRFLEEDAGVVGEIARREIIGAIDDDVVRADDIESVLAGDAGVMDDDFDVGIELVDCFLRRFCFRTADVFGGVKDLALEVGE